MVEPSQLPMMPQKLDMALFPAREDAGDRKAITVTAALALLKWAEGYGLDAWQGHVCYMFGKPYVTARGAVANALKDARYLGYTLVSVPPDLLAQQGFKPDSWVWKCTVRSSELSEGITEYGEVTVEEVRRLQEEHKERAQYLPIVNNPNNQARVRAIRRAHLLAFPLHRQGGEEETCRRKRGNTSTTVLSARLPTGRGGYCGGGTG